MDPHVCTEGLVCLVAGTGEAGFNGDGLPGAETRLYLPSSVFSRPDSSVAFVDFNNYRLRHIDEDGLVQTFAGNGLHAYATPGAAPLETALENPVDVAPHEDGLIVAPLHEARVLQLDTELGVTVLVGTGIPGDTPAWPSPQDPSVLRIQQAASVAVDGTGGLLIADELAHKIRGVDADGNALDLLGTGEEGAGVAGDAPNLFALDRPRWVRAAGPADFVVADSGNHRVVRRTGDVVTVLAGTGEAGFSGDGGPAQEATLNDPAAVLVEDDVVWIADQRNGVVRRIEDGVIETVLGGGGVSIDEGAVKPLDLELLGPAGLARAPDGTLLIADQLGHRVYGWLGAP